MTRVTEPVVTLFHAFVVLHILFGSLGLVAFWIPVLGRKGSPTHRRWGRVFTWTMLATGTAAVGISICTLIDPQGTHPHLENPSWIRGIFGWMMLGLAILTVNLAWYGWSCIQHRENHRGHREWRNLGLQALLTVAALVTEGAWLRHESRGTHFRDDRPARDDAAFCHRSIHHCRHYYAV